VVDDDTHLHTKKDVMEAIIAIEARDTGQQYIILLVLFKQGALLPMKYWRFGKQDTDSYGCFNKLNVKD
jgi:hypothetical protein